MKANAPENIYIQPDAQDGWFMVNNLNNTLVKYTRTDAFIEKAERYIRSVADGLDRDDDVEAFISDFRKYMKGE